MTMPESQTPTPQAMAAARKFYERIFGNAPVLSDDGANWWLDEIVAALDAYAAERIEDATDGDRTFARLAQVERERDDIARESLAAIAGRQRAEKLFADEAAARATAERLLQAAEKRVRVLEAALRSIIDHEGRPCIANERYVSL